MKTSFQKCAFGLKPSCCSVVSEALILVPAVQRSELFIFAINQLAAVPMHDFSTVSLSEAYYNLYRKIQRWAAP